MTLGFQLYSARSAPALAPMLESLAAIGYSHVEPYADLYADLPVLLDAMARSGLRARSGHFALAALEADPRPALAAASALGIDLVVIPAIPLAEQSQPLAGWRALGARLERLTAVVGAAGMRLAWHNHAFEMAALEDGTIALEHLLECAPGLLWQADVAWVARGGRDPWALLEAYRDRVVSVHLKDLAPAGECEDEDGWADFGHGVLDWAGHWPSLGHLAAEHRVVEHDRPNDVDRFARRAFASVRRLDRSGSAA